MNGCGMISGEVIGDTDPQDRARSEHHLRETRSATIGSSSCWGLGLPGSIHRLAGSRSRRKSHRARPLRLTTKMMADLDRLGCGASSRSAKPTGVAADPMTMLAFAIPIPIALGRRPAIAGCQEPHSRPRRAALFGGGGLLLLLGTAAGAQTSCLLQSLLDVISPRQAARFVMPAAIIIATAPANLERDR
jgi:hypothetical protein